MKNEDNFNQQLVGVQRDRVIIMLPRASMTAQEALVQAAWLVVNAETVELLNEEDQAPRGPTIEERFLEILRDVRSS